MNRFPHEVFDKSSESVFAELIERLRDHFGRRLWVLYVQQFNDSSVFDVVRCGVGLRGPARSCPRTGVADWHIVLDVDPMLAMAKGAGAMVDRALDDILYEARAFHGWGRPVFRIGTRDRLRLVR